MTELNEEETETIINGIERMRPFIEALSKMLADSHGLWRLQQEANRAWRSEDDE